MDYNDPNDYWQGYDPYKGLSDNERMEAGCLHSAAIIVAFMVGLLLCALLGSCTTTQYVPVVEHRTDTLLCYSSIRDSIYVHDSIHVHERGDTVTVERWHTRWRDRWQHDTLYISKTDSVPTPYPVEVVKQVPRERSTVEWVLLMSGLLAIAWIIIRIAIKIKHV